MVKVNVGTMSAQASSVSAIVSQRVSALTDAKQSLSSFASQDQLKGAAYQNAKAYATSVLGPLIDGMILLSEETEKGVTKLQTLYAEKCGSESLDSEVLTDKIEKDQELLIKIQDLQAHLEKHASFLSHALDGLEATVKARLRKNKKKLKNLMEFNAESSSVFEALAEFQDSVSTGLSFVSTGFNNFNGTFDTSGKGLEWTKTIKTGMEVRKEAKAKELKRKKSNETYDGKDALTDFQTETTDYMNYGTEAAGQQFDKFGKIIIKDGKNIGKVYGAKLQPRDANGRFVKDTNPLRKSATSKLKGITNAQSKTIGRCARVGGRALIAYNYYADAKEHYDEYHNVGRAMSYSAVTTTTGVVAGSIGASVATGIATTAGFAATGIVASVIAPVIGAVAVGAVAVIGVKALYSNVKPIKNAVDCMGDGLNKIGKSFTKSFSWV
ncbi:hypothetical protein MXZ28_06885 [Streptococcus uberis]|nr:hypothetical protein [Streptococcus uberis]MCK1165783.1 hypothetical protein [Streptococcus uberis]MCK1251946.1 hypothetical protein [Streptococcus uberis]